MPQHTSSPLRRTAQACACPTDTSECAPPGASLISYESMPQHCSQPLRRRPQGFECPEATSANSRPGKHSPRTSSPRSMNDDLCAGGGPLGTEPQGLRLTAQSDAPRSDHFDVRGVLPAGGNVNEPRLLAPGTANRADAPEATPSTRVTVWSPQNPSGAEQPRHP